MTKQIPSHPPIHKNGVANERYKWIFPLKKSEFMKTTGHDLKGRIQFHSFSINHRGPTDTSSPSGYTERHRNQKRRQIDRPNGDRRYEIRHAYDVCIDIQRCKLSQSSWWLSHKKGAIHSHRMATTEAPTNRNSDSFRRALLAFLKTLGSRRNRE